MIYWKRPKRRRVKLPGGRQLIGATFQVEKFNNEGNVTYKGPKFNNLVLTVGLDMWHNQPARSLVSWCNVGTNATEPAIGQSGLLAYLASSSSRISRTRGYETADPAHVSMLTTYEFAIGSCTGNLVEVGLSRSENDNYFNRQLFRDQYGDPTTITVLENEGIRVISEVFVYSDMQSGEVLNETFMFNEEEVGIEKRFNIGSDYGFTDTSSNRQLFGSRWNKSDLHIAISGSDELWDRDSYVRISRYNSGSPLEDYVPGSFERVATDVWPAGTFVGDLKRIVSGYYGGQYSGRQVWYYDHKLVTPIEVTDVEELTFSVKDTWGRYEGGT